MVKIEDRDKPIQKVSPQGRERVAIATKTMGRIDELKETRKNEFKIVRNRTWTDYWDDGVKRLTQFKQRPSYKQAWQSNTASNTPADKLFGILSQLASQAMEAQVMATNELSKVSVRKEKILGKLLKAANRKNQDDYQLILEMFSAMAKGTVIGFESWRFGKTKVRDVTNQDPETGEVTIKTRTINKWNDVHGEIVPIENFYPGNVFVRPGKVQDMSDCAMRKIFKWDDWQLQFGKYIDANLVLPKDGTRSKDSEDDLFYKFNEDVDINEVEQWYYFNKDTDEMVIIANGIWINPMGVDTVAPLPWNHKKLPFWAAVMEPLQEDIFYGRSMADKLISMVDTQDALFDRMLDQLALAVHKPIITRKNATQFTRGFMQPGAVIQVKGSGPVGNEVSTLDVQEPSQAHVQMLQIIQSRLDRTAITSETSAQGGGQRKTATQVIQEREAAVELASLFLKLMEFAMRDKYSLRLPNMIQFYTLPTNKNQKESKFRKIVLREEKLSNGELGTMEVQFTNKNIAGQQEEVVRQSEEMEEATEVIRVSPRFIRDFEGEIMIIPATSVKQTETVKQAFELNFQQVMNSLYPDKLNRDTGFEDLARVFKKDVKRLKAETPAEVEDMNPLEQQGGGQQAPEKIMQGLGGSLRELAQG